MEELKGIGNLMKRSVISLFEAMEEKLSGYVAVANYRYMNLCVKAEEVSLLSVRVNVEGEEKNIEEVAQVSKKGDYQFVAIPNYPEDLLPLAQGIAMQHPEFKQEFDAENVEVGDGEGNPQTVKVKMLILTMPEVDDDRYDVLKKAVDAAYDECKVEMEAVVSQTKTQITPLLAGEEPADVKRVKDGIEKSEKTWAEHRDKFHNEKLKEVEEAHNKWKAKQAENMLNRIRSEE